MDALRLVSIAAVVLGHAYLTDLTFSRYLEIWRMPLFFFLTGYFWTRGRPFARDARGRFKALMVPYLVWAVVMSAAALAWLVRRVTVLPMHAVSAATMAVSGLVLARAHWPAANYAGWSLFCVFAACFAVACSSASRRLARRSSCCCRWRSGS